MNILSLKYKILLTTFLVGGLFFVLLELVASNHNDWEITLGIGFIFGYIVSLFFYQKDLKVPKFINRVFAKAIIVLSIVALVMVFVYSLLSYSIFQSHVPGFIIVWSIIIHAVLLCLMMLTKIFMKDIEVVEY